MAGRDHGELLTRFEEIFGSQIDHEVIKMVLQSCDWDAASASDNLLSMVDRNDLPPHVLSALTADSIMRGLDRRQPASPVPSEDHAMGSQVSNYPRHMTQGDPQDENLPPTDSLMSDLDRSQLTSSLLSEILTSGPQVSNYPMDKTQGEGNGHGNPCGDEANADHRSLPLSTIESTSEKPIITVPSSASAFPHASPSRPHNARSEEEGGAGSPLLSSASKSDESVSSSPSFSPLKFNKSDVGDTLEARASQWVTAPQFAPNAFNFKSSEMRNKRGLWPQGMSSRLIVALPSANAPPPKQEIMEVKLSKKEKIIDKILHGTKMLIIMRGLPGSGKSTLAREMKGARGVVLSTDDFFCDKHGKYIYEPAKIGEAHQWNQHRASLRLKQGKSPIIIDNTNLQVWEMKPYVKMALQYGYDVELLDADTPWRLNAKELGKRNSHGVPTKKIEEMKERYELNVEIEDIVAGLQGLGLVQSSPSRNSGSKARGVIALENDLKGTKFSKCSPSRTPKKSMNANQNAEPTAPEDDFSILNPSLEGKFDYESDEDVVIEGYDEMEPDEAEIHVETTADELQAIEISPSITESGHEKKEAASCESEELDNMKTSEEAENTHVDENIPSDSLIDLTHALVTCSTKEQERKDQEILNDTKKTRSESDVNGAKLINGTGAYDEIEIQDLLEEASKSIDINQSEAEWDNLTSHISGEDVSDEKFEDLVTSLGTVLRKQIEGKGSVSEANGCSVESESVTEDFAMYDLIRTMEDKTGQSLSALVTKLAKSDGATDMPSIENAGGEEACEFVPSNTEADTENLTQNLSTLKLSENGPDISSAGSEGSHKPLDNDLEHVTKEPLPKERCEVKEEHKVKKNLVSSGGDTECPIPNEVSGLPQSNTNVQMGHDSFVSWECVDINSGLSSDTWDSKTDNANLDKDARGPKPCRNQRNRAPGDPTKWLSESDAQSESVDETIASWVPLESGTPQWDSSEPARITPEPSPPQSGGASAKYLEVEEPQSHTGAVSKFRKHKRRSNSTSPNSKKSGKGGSVPIVTVSKEQSKTTYKEVETQTLSIDFEALQLDHKLYELKVVFGRPHYAPVTTVSSNFSDKGPLTKGGLRLEKGTMTENMYESSVSTFQNLVAFFPNIPKEDLRDVFEKCRYDTNWAMNVLLDSGYEMSADPTNVPVNETEVDIETESVSDMTNTDEGRNDESSCDTSDVAFDNFADERTRKIRQSQQPDDLAKKLEIEKSFAFPSSVDDRVLRLTGKQYSDLNMTKVKKTKNKKQHGKGNSLPVSTKPEESVEEEGEGAQYVTLVMDPLFASQLNMMFGPVGDYEISGDLTFEDRSVVLPLEICEMIHKYWARTVNGRFKHEAEILDSLVRQDEILARKLQEEENAGFNISDKSDDVPHDSSLEDQPVRFQEIMDLEQALQESLSNKSSPEDTSISSILNLKRLYKEYPHVDPVALKEEYIRNGSKYHTTVKKLNQRFGKEQGTPKTVIAPEALSRYEQEMIERAQQDSLVDDEEELPSDQHEEIVPDDPQVFRDEAQAHYHQRQEAFQKAQEASRRGMKAAASYYAHIGNLHSEKLREANQRASQKILEAKNANRKDANCLDLHLLHVPEALSATQAFLNERQRVLVARGIKQMEVSLITGRGVHSAGGQAILKPAIKEHLQKNGYSVCEVNSGMLKVILRAKPS